MFVELFPASEGVDGFEFEFSAWSGDDRREFADWCRARDINDIMGYQYSISGVVPERHVLEFKLRWVG